MLALSNCVHMMPRVISAAKSSAAMKFRIIVGYTIWEPRLLLRFSLSRFLFSAIKLSSSRFHAGSVRSFVLNTKMPRKSFFPPTNLSAVDRNNDWSTMN